MSQIKNYLSLIKFSHTIFAMPFAMIGFFLGIFNQVKFGDGQLNLNKTIGWGNTPVTGDGATFDFEGWKPFIFLLTMVILCMVFARSAAMSFNRWLDRRFDAKNPRTAVREIPSGIIKPNKVLTFTIINSILFIVCTYFINQLCFFLSPIALAIILGYSYTKRFTPLCHLILGLGLSLAPIGSYLAVTGTFAVLPILFSLTVIFWVSGFDIIYSLQDEEFDKSEKLYSIPASVGKSKALLVSSLLHVFSAAAVVYAGIYGKFSWIYWVGAASFVGMLIYQHLLVKPSDLGKVNVAFMSANGVASVVFAVLVIADLFSQSNI